MRPPIKDFVLPWALVLVVFAVFAAWPVPDSNESGYLPQARRFWDADYCPGDLFLASPPPHRLFCAATGWAARHVSLETLAWTGRLLTWSFLAAGWVAMGLALRLTTPGIGLAAACYVVLSYACQVAGEWIVGGFEAKGLAWSLVWFAIARRLRGDLPGALGLAGVAAAWHVLVGGWATIGLLLTAWPRPGSPAGRSAFSGSNLRTLLLLAIGAVGAAVGLLPALALDQGVDPTTRAEAARVYVFECAPFHLLPEHFYFVRVFACAAHLTVWVLLARRLRGDPGDPPRNLRRLVNAALGIAAVGLAIRFLTWSDTALTARLMRYYWFRLADGLLPVGTALLGVMHLGLVHENAEQVRRRAGQAIGLLAGSVLAGLVVYRGLFPAPRSEDQLADPVAWQQACRWVRDNTPPDSVVLVPPDTQTLHWRAERAEVATQKDLPHDATGILEWKVRYDAVSLAYRALDTAETPADIGASADALRRVAGWYGARFIICRARPPLPLERVDAGGGYYAVYRSGPR